MTVLMTLWSRVFDIRLVVLPVAHAKCTLQFKMADSGKPVKTEAAYLSSKLVLALINFCKLAV